MNNQQRQLLESALELLHRIIGLDDAEKDFDAIQRSKFRFVGSDENVIPFPGNAKKPLPASEEAIIFSTANDGLEEPSAETEQGFVYFTDKEIQTMPTKFRRLIVIQGKRCRMRKRKSGEKTFTYQIRYRSQGYNVSGDGVTIELAKKRFLENLKNAQPVQKGSIHGTPGTFHSFAMHYFENFRKPRVAEKTYHHDCCRYKRYLEPTFSETPLTKITPTDCKNLLDSVLQQGKGKTADELRSLLNGIFNSAIAHGIIDRNPLAIVFYLPHEREEGKALTQEEERTLLRWIRSDECDCAQEIALLLFCGLRPNEMENEKHPPEIHGEFIKAVNSKRHFKDKSRIEFKFIPICQALRPFLENGFHLRLSARAVRKRMQKILPNCTLKDLRTTFYTRCQTFGIAEVALKEFMGHSFGKLGNAYSDLEKHQDYLLLEGKKLDQWKVDP